MSLVNAFCAEISVYEGIGEATGVVVERAAIRGRTSLCKSLRDLATKARVFGDGYYYVPAELWTSKKPVVINRREWKVMSSIPRTGRRTKASSGA